MVKYFRIWQNKKITSGAKNIDDFIEIFENHTHILKKWKKEGVYLDPNSNIYDDHATFFTTNLQNANEEGFKQEESEELAEETESQIKHEKSDDKDNTRIYDMIKICVFSKYEIIKEQFFKTINAGFFDRITKERIGVEFGILSYQKSKKHIFQFWSISNKHRHEQMIPNFILGSRGIIYFYQINEKIEEDRLNLVKRNKSSKIPILFVGYDTILSQKPEQNDDNILLIKKYFDKFNSLYISVNNQDSMFQILDKIISLDTSE